VLIDLYLPVQEHERQVFELGDILAKRVRTSIAYWRAMYATTAPLDRQLVLQFAVRLPVDVVIGAIETTYSRVEDGNLAAANVKPYLHKVLSNKARRLRGSDQGLRQVR